MNLPMRPAVFAKAVKTLAPRELEMVKLVAMGMGNQEIAKALGLSIKTVENTLVRAMKKFDPKVSRGELIRLWTLAEIR